MVNFPACLFLLVYISERTGYVSRSEESTRFAFNETTLKFSQVSYRNFGSISMFQTQHRLFQLQRSLRCFRVPRNIFTKSHFRNFFGNVIVTRNIGRACVQSQIQTSQSIFFYLESLRDGKYFQRPLSFPLGFLATTFRIQICTYLRENTFQSSDRTKAQGVLGRSR